MKSPECLSHDYLKHVQGLTLHQPMSVDGGVDAMVFPGDPVIIKHNQQACVSSISKIYNGATEIDSMSAETVNDDRFKLVTKFLNLYCDGSFKTYKEIPILTSNHMLIQPAVNNNPPDGMSVYHFAMDVGVHLNLSTPDPKFAQDFTRINEGPCRKTYH